MYRCIDVSLIVSCLNKCQFTVCLLQPDDAVNVAVEKINSLLETFLGISDTELGKVFKNLQPFVITIFQSLLHCVPEKMLTFFV